MMRVEPSRLALFVGMAAVALPLLLLVACGEKPDPSQLERARNAVAVAESLDAPRLAPEEWAAVQEALAAAEKEYDKTLGRSAQEGQKLAKKVVDLAKKAGKAAEKAENGRLRVAREALTQCDTVLIQVEASLARLSRCARENHPVHGLRELGERLLSVRERLEAANGSFDGREFEAAAKDAEWVAAEAERIRVDANNSLVEAECP